ncbi:MAG: bifunctional UDP-N-acetylglucosamine diphosphorylase/glucosamine-1-phosphate N-acetyltransferase GlmU [Ruminococcaceae bacterium]|nr:bifunctional UDP-N-acetylglucosamine diphosphorylase/glucosamine-1-phosphate N-acetyltransferase GlmU [Oscillospiraceae bacterium]
MGVVGKNCAVVLAAGEGKRMKSNKPKVLACVLFKPMLDWVLDAVSESGINDTCVVLGHLGEMVEIHLDGRCEIVYQKERLGTGHAVMQAIDYLNSRDAENVLILAGDAPFIDPLTIEESLRKHILMNNAVTVISARIKKPFGYGRIVRDKKGNFIKIVEQTDTTEEENLINEVNSGAYWFDKQCLVYALEHISDNNASSEYYLTDTIDELRKIGKKTYVFMTDNSDVALGANDRFQLMELNEIARRKILLNHLVNGVEIPCMDGIIIGTYVTIGAGTLLLPNTIIKGRTIIGSNCELGPNTFINSSVVHDNVRLNNVYFESSEISNGADMGPFAHVRPNSIIGEGVHVGNFVEIKNSTIGEKSKLPHLSYVGDSDLGKNVNFGCGALTVNYDGKVKSKTTIKDNAFVGCNVNLIAPVTVGEYTYVAAGSTITENAPDGALSIARARQVNKEDWVSKKKPYKDMPKKKKSK